MTTERRRHPRVSVLPADLKVVKAKAYELVATIDFSVGGMRIEVTRLSPPPRVSDLLDVTLQMGGFTQVFNATVRRVIPMLTQPGEPERWQLGIEFDDPELVSRFVDTDETI